MNYTPVFKKAKKIGMKIDCFCHGQQLPQASSSKEGPIPQGMETQNLLPSQSKSSDAPLSKA